MGHGYTAFIRILKRFAGIFQRAFSLGPSHEAKWRMAPLQPRPPRPFASGAHPSGRGSAPRTVRAGRHPPLHPIPWGKPYSGLQGLALAENLSHTKFKRTFEFNLMQELRSSSTRESILDTAEALFAQQGHDGTSMRQITGAAGVNLASVNYHFGSKESLVRRCSSAAWRAQQRAHAPAGRARSASRGKPLKPSQIVDAFFGTLLRLAADPEQAGSTFLPLLERTMTDPTDFIRALFAEEYADVSLPQRAFAALPDVRAPKSCGAFNSCWARRPTPSSARTCCARSPAGSSTKPNNPTIPNCCCRA